MVRVRRYGGPFGLSDIRGAVDAVLQHVGKVHDLEPSLTLDVEECRRAVNTGRELVKEYPSFLAVEFFNKFLDNVERTLADFLASAKGRFSTRIRLGAAGADLTKRYPLHEADRDLEVLVPLINSGPGLATDVRVSVVGDSPCIALSNEIVFLGNVAPGEFSVSIDVLTVEPCDKFNALLQIEWGELEIQSGRSNS